MSTELGVAYVTIMPDMSKFGSAVFKGVDKVAVTGGRQSAGAFGKGLLGGIKGISVGTAIGNLLSSAVGAISSSVASAVSRADTLANFPRIMQNLGYGADEATAAIGRMSAGIDGLPTSLDGIASATTKIAPLTGSLGKATEVSLALNNALLAGGKDAQTQANALEQFSQMLAVGKVDMAAWRSMVSAMPGQLDQLSVALLGAGKGNMDLYEAMKGGNVTFEQFNDALLDLNANGVAGFASFEKQARDATQGIGTAVENAKNRISKALAVVIDEIGQGTIAGAINGVTSRFGGMAGLVVDGIKGIKTSLDTSRIARSFERIADSARGVSGHLLGAFTRIGATIGDLATRVGTAAGGFATALSGKLPGVLDSLSGALSSVIEYLGDGLVRTLEVVTPLIEPLAAAFGTVLDVFSALVDAANTVRNAIADELVGALGSVDFSPLTDGFKGVSMFVQEIDLTPLTNGIHEIADAWGGLVVGIDAGPIADAFSQVGDGLASFGDAIAPGISAVTDFITGTGPAFEGMVQRIQDHVGQFGGVWDNLTTAFGNLGDALTPIVNVLGPALAEFLGNAISGAVGLIGVIGNVIAFFTQFVADIVNAVWELPGQIGEAFGQIATLVSSVFEGIKTTAVNIWNAIKTNISTVVGNISSSVSNAFNTIKSNISNAFNSIKSTATNVWNGVKTAIVTPINAAKDTVKNVINTIKGFFNFKITWPHIPLPHISYDLIDVPLLGSIPNPTTLHVDWYAKGGIVNGPTLIGAGERGPELVQPLTNPYMRGYAETIGEVVASMLGDSGDGSAALLTEVRALRNDLARLNLTLDGRVVAGYLSPYMDAAQSRHARLRGYA